MTKEQTVEGWGEAKEVQSNWFKFEVVGDKIKGTLLKKYLQVSKDGVFPDQWIYELKREDGQVYNVGISANKSGTIARLNNCKVGEIIGIVFDSVGEVKKKGFAPAKNLKVFSFGMDLNYNEMSGGEEVSVEDDALNDM
jgi:hypothetical protein